MISFSLNTTLFSFPKYTPIKIIPLNVFFSSCFVPKFITQAIVNTIIAFIKFFFILTPVDNEENPLN